MSRTKKLIINSLLLCSLCCISTMSPVWAELNNEQNSQKEYLSVIYDENQNVEESIKSYIDAAQNGCQNGNPLKSMEALIKAENLLKKVSSNTELKNQYNMALIDFYSHYDQFENALKIYNDIKTQDINQKICLTRQKVWMYSALKRFSEAKKELKNLQNLITKEYGSNPKELFYYYVDYAYFLFDSHQLNEFLQIKDKLQSLLAKIPEGEEHLRAEIDLNQLLITYYDYNNMNDKELELLNTNIKLAEANGINYKDNTTHFYKNYYYSIYDFKSIKNILDQSIKKTKVGNAPNSVDIMYLYYDYADYYNTLTKFKNSEKYLAKMANLIEPYKNIIPLRYGDAMKKIGKLKKDKGENEKALVYLTEAERYNAKATSPNSYPYYEIYKTKGEVHRNMDKNDIALEYYTKAENIIKNLQGTYLTRDSYEIEKDIAYAYAKKKDSTNAINKIENAIKIAEKIYNKNNVEVQNLYFDKFNILNYFGKPNEAEKVLNQISAIVDTNQMEGYNYDFIYDYYTTMILKNLDANNKDKAINYLQKVEKYAKKKYQKRELKDLKAKIRKK